MRSRCRELHVVQFFCISGMCFFKTALRFLHIRLPGIPPVQQTRQSYGRSLKTQILYLSFNLMKLKTGTKYNVPCTQYFPPVEHWRRPACQICGDCSCCDITPRVSCKNLTFSIYLMMMTTIMVTMMSMMIFQRSLQRSLAAQQ